MRPLVALFLLSLCFLMRLFGAEPDNLVSVSVLGQVNAPGKYEVTKAELNLYSLLLRAGGPTQAARWGQGVMIIRVVDGETKRIVYKIEVHDLLKEGADSKFNLKIQPGDAVDIMERVF